MAPDSLVVLLVHIVGVFGVGDGVGVDYFVGRPVLA